MLNGEKVWRVVGSSEITDVSYKETKENSQKFYITNCNTQSIFKILFAYLVIQWFYFFLFIILLLNVFDVIYIPFNKKKRNFNLSVRRWMENNAIWLNLDLISTKNCKNLKKKFVCLSRIKVQDFMYKFYLKWLMFQEFSRTIIS